MLASVTRVTSCGQEQCAKRSLIVGCDTAEEARRAEYSLRKKHGGWGKRFDGLDPAAIFVYTFRMSATTIPNQR